MKAKRVTVSKMKKKVWVIFSEYIRKRDCLRTTGSIHYGECITCDNPPQHRYEDLDAGHFVAGRHNGNLFSEKGCHAQCRRCNRFLAGNPLEYRDAIIELYGEEVEQELRAEAKKPKKFTIPELEKLLEVFKQKIKELNDGG